jgi:hypothetical protein
LRGKKVIDYYVENEVLDGMKDISPGKGLNSEGGLVLLVMLNVRRER